MSDLPERGRIRRIKSQGHHLRETDSILPRLDNAFQYIIVPFQGRNNPSLYTPARADFMIVMTILTLLTTELLVRPAVTDFISALQASGSTS